MKIDPVWQGQNRSVCLSVCFSLCYDCSYYQEALLPYFCQAQTLSVCGLAGAHSECALCDLKPVAELMHNALTIPMLAAVKAVYPALHNTRNCRLDLGEESGFSLSQDAYGWQDGSFLKSLCYSWRT